MERRPAGPSLLAPLLRVLRPAAPCLRPASRLMGSVKGARLLAVSDVCFPSLLLASLWDLVSSRTGPLTCNSLLLPIIRLYNEASVGDERGIS